MEIEQKDIQRIYGALDNIKLVLADTNELVQKISNILDRNEEMEARAINDMARISGK